MKYKLLYLAIIAFMILSCDDLFVTTQKDDLEIEVRDDVSEIYADGESRLDFTIILSRRPGSSETVDIDISSGKILNLSGLQADTNANDSHITVHPNRQKNSFAIISSKIPNDKVILGVRNNGNYISKIISFKRSCPDEIHFDLLKNKFPLSEVSQTIGKIDLTSRDIKVSSDVRIDVILSDNHLATCDSRIYYKGESINLNLLPLGEEGDLEITLKVNEASCEQTEIKRKITFFKQ